MIQKESESEKKQIICSIQPKTKQSILILENLIKIQM